MNISTDILLVASIALLGGIVIVGVFWTKQRGFGRFTSALLLLVSVLFIAALLLAAGKIEPQFFVNIALAIAGFAGGLISGSGIESTNKSSEKVSGTQIGK